MCAYKFRIQSYVVKLICTHYFPLKFTRCEHVVKVYTHEKTCRNINMVYTNLKKKIINTYVNIILYKMCINLWVLHTN